MIDTTTTHTLEVPGAVLTYDVRPADSSRTPPLIIIGSPMGACGIRHSWRASSRIARS